MIIMDQIWIFIVENFLYGDERKIAGDTSLIQSGVIDSTGILELVSFLEKAFNITVEDDELVPENLDSLKNISSFVERKRNISSSALN